MNPSHKSNPIKTAFLLSLALIMTATAEDVSPPAVTETTVAPETPAVSAPQSIDRPALRQERRQKRVERRKARQERRKVRRDKRQSRRKERRETRQTRRQERRKVRVENLNSSQ